MASRLPDAAPRALPLLAFGLSLLVAGTAPALAQQDDEPPPDASSPASPVPNGNDCAGVIARWQDFSGRESRGGHMGEAVYNQVQNEIDRASHLCEAGQDAQARRAVAESKRKHGY